MIIDLNNELSDGEICIVYRDISGEISVIKGLCSHFSVVKKGIEKADYISGNSAYSGKIDVSASLMNEQEEQ